MIINVTEKECLSFVNRSIIIIYPKDNPPFPALSNTIKPPLFQYVPFFGEKAFSNVLIVAVPDMVRNSVKLQTMLWEPQDMPYR